MNAEVKTRWVSALRSGGYTQTRGALQRVRGGENRPVGFCCLGVLCDLAVQEGVITPLGTSTCGTTMYPHPGPDWQDATLPPSVRDWAGLTHPNPDVPVPLEGRPANKTSLATLNDAGYTFEDIADIIEEYL